MWQCCLQARALPLNNPGWGCVVVCYHATIAAVHCIMWCHVFEAGSWWQDVPLCSPPALLTSTPTPSSHPIPSQRCCPACGELCGPPSLWEPGLGWPEPDSTTSKPPPWHPRHGSPQSPHWPRWCRGATWAHTRWRSPWSRSTRPGERRSLFIVFIRLSAPACCENCTGSSP